MYKPVDFGRIREICKEYFGNIQNKVLGSVVKYS